MYLFGKDDEYKAGLAAKLYGTYKELDFTKLIRPTPVAEVGRLAGKTAKRPRTSVSGLFRFG